MVTTEVDIEALLHRPKLFSGAEVPLAGKAGRITRFFECFRQCDFFQVHAVIKGCWFEASLPSTCKEVGRVGAGGIATSHDRITSRRTYRVCRVAIGEAAARSCDAIAIGRLVEAIRIVGADVHDAEIVDQEKDDIGFGRGKKAGKCEGEEE